MKFPRPIFLSLALLLAALTATSAAAQSGQIEATLTAPPGEYRVGDPIVLTLAVTHPAGYQVILEELPSDWGGFTVQSQSPLTTLANPDGSETTTQLIDTRLFAPGDFSTPSLDVTISDPAGALTQVTALPAAVSVLSVLVEGDTQLRDIKPQADLPYLNLVPWLAGALLLALAVVVILLWRHSRQRKAANASIDNRLPNEVALDELARILALGLPESGRFKEYYSLLSDCIRTYMEALYRIPALERTTFEIQTSLRGASVDPQIVRQFISFLSGCDLVKFSRFTPDLVEAHQSLVDARLLVERTWNIASAPSTAPPDDQAGLPTPQEAARPMELTA